MRRLGAYRKRSLGIAQAYACLEILFSSLSCHFFNKIKKIIYKFRLLWYKEYCISHNYFYRKGDKHGKH